MATAIVPPIYDPNLADQNIEMDTERAYAMAQVPRPQPRRPRRRLRRRRSRSAALQVAEEEHAKGREAVIVTILCDGADKYMSERFWPEE